MKSNKTNQRQKYCLVNWISLILLCCFVISHCQQKTKKTLKIPLKQNKKSFLAGSATYCENHENMNGYFSDLTFTGIIEFGNDSTTSIKTVFDTRYNQNWLIQTEQSNYSAFSSILNELSSNDFYRRCPLAIQVFDGKCIQQFQKDEQQPSPNEELFRYKNRSFERKKCLLNSRLEPSSEITVTLEVNAVSSNFQDLLFIRAFSGIGLGFGSGLMNQLVQKGIVEESVFSFHFESDLENSEDSGDSYLLLGGYNPALLNNPEEIFYFQVVFTGERVNHADWSVLGDQIKLVSHSFELTSIIFDSVSSFIRLPSNAYEEYKRYLLDNFLYVTQVYPDDPYLIIPCSQKYNLPQLEITFIDTFGQFITYTYFPSKFVQKSERSFDGITSQSCEVLIRQTRDDDEQDPNTTLVLGTSFMRQYVTIFNFDHQKVGLSNPKFNKNQT